MSNNPYNCPKCLSDTTQSIPMLFQTGVQHGVSQTAMGGIGIGSGGKIGVGMGSASTASSSSTALVKKYAMGHRPRISTGQIVLGWLFTSFGAIMILPMLAMTSTGAGGGVETGMGCMFGISCSFLIPGLVLIFTYPSHKRRIASQQESWDARRDYLGKTWVCFRCGQEFQPE